MCHGEEQHPANHAWQHLVADMLHYVRCQCAAVGCMLTCRGGPLLQERQQVVFATTSKQKTKLVDSPPEISSRIPGTTTARCSAEVLHQISSSCKQTGNVCTMLHTVWCPPALPSPCHVMVDELLAQQVADAVWAGGTEQTVCSMNRSGNMTSGCIGRKSKTLK